MAIIKRKLDTSDYNLFNTDVYLEYDDEVYNITLCDKEHGHHNIVITDRKSGEALNVFDASTTGFIVQKEFNKKPLLFVSYFDKENRKNYLQKYGSTLCSGTDSPVSVPSIKYEQIYLGYGSFIMNDEVGICRYPGNLIYNPFQNKISRNFRKIYIFEIPKHPKYVHVTELIAFDRDEFGMTRNYDEVTYGIDLETLEICTSIYSQNMDEYFELEQLEPDLDAFHYTAYLHGSYDTNNQGDVVIVNKIIRPLVDNESKACVPNLNKLTRKRT